MCVFRLSQQPAATQGGIRDTGCHGKISAQKKQNKKKIGNTPTLD
jgi:hypothetical protein